MTGAEFCRKLKARGKRPIVVGEVEVEEEVTAIVDLRGIVVTRSVHLRKLVFLKEVDLSECRFEGSLRIESCQFPAGLRLTGVHVGGLLSLRGSTFIYRPEPEPQPPIPPEKSLDWRRMRVDGLLDATSVTSRVCLDLENLRAGDDVLFNGVDVASAIPTKADRPTNAQVPESDVVLRSKKLVGQAIMLRGARIRKDICFRNVTDRRVRCVGAIDLRGDVGGNVLFEGASLSVAGMEAEDGIALNLEGTRVGDSVIFRIGEQRRFKCRGQINLRAEVRNNIECVGIHVTTANVNVDRNIAIYFGPVQVGNSVHFAAGEFIRGQNAISVRCRCSGEICFLQSRIKNSIYFTSISARAKASNPESAAAAIVFDRAVLGGSILFIGSIPRAAVGAGGGEVEDPKVTPCKVFGRIDAKGLTCTTIWTKSLVVTEHLNMPYAKIHSHARLNGAAFLGGLELLHTEIDGDLLLDRAQIGSFNKPLRYEPGQGDLARYYAIDARHVKVHGRILAEDVNRPTEASTEVLRKFGWPEGCPPASDQDAQWDFEAARIEGNMRLSGSHLLGSLQMEDAVVSGDVNLSNTIIERDLVMRSTEVHGRIFADETDRVDGPFPMVGGTVDLSNARLRQVWISIKPVDPLDQTNGAQVAASGTAATNPPAGTPAPALRRMPRQIVLNGIQADELILRGTLPEHFPNIQINDAKFGLIDVTALTITQPLYFVNVLQRIRDFLLINVTLPQPKPPRWPRLAKYWRWTSDTTNPLSWACRIVMALVLAAVWLWGGGVTLLARLGATTFSEDSAVCIAVAPIVFALVLTWPTCRMVRRDLSWRHLLRIWLFCVLTLLCWVALRRSGASIFSVVLWYLVAIILVGGVWRYFLRWGAMREWYRPEKRFWPNWLKNQFEAAKTTNAMIAFLDRTEPFSHSAYMEVEKSFRNCGDDTKADDVFLARRKRETQNLALLFPRSAEKSRGAISATAALVGESALSEKTNAHLWSFVVWFWREVLDLTMGYGVRVHRAVFMFCALWLFNTAVFTNPESVERPLSFIQHSAPPLPTHDDLETNLPNEDRSGRAAVQFVTVRPAVWTQNGSEVSATTIRFRKRGNASPAIGGSLQTEPPSNPPQDIDSPETDPLVQPPGPTPGRKGRTNPWPADGGTAHGEEPGWSQWDGFFVAMRIQFPFVELVAENDWEPSSRHMDIFPGITYENYASACMIVNLILLPTIIAGLTGYIKRHP